VIGGPAREYRRDSSDMRAHDGSNRTFLFPIRPRIGHNNFMKTTHACGIVAPIPWELLTDELPPVFSNARERRALGTFFMPRGRMRELTGIVEQTLLATGWTTLQWRRVPVCFDGFDHQRRESLPAILQLAAIAEKGPGRPPRALDKVRLYLETHALRQQARGFAVVSLSTSTVIYKGLLSPEELRVFYPDLREPAFQAPFAVLQRKISASATPLWSMAPPLHTLAHNGELRHTESHCA
jgi:glutamate synthase domain-containing protein 1